MRGCVRVDERRELLKDETRTIEKRREVDQSRSRFEVEEKLRRRKWDEERERERERVVVRGKKGKGDKGILALLFHSTIM